jgi:hypothetical protein
VSSADLEALRAVVKKAARELYALEVRRQSMGWEDGMTERLVALQHELAAALTPEIDCEHRVLGSAGAAAFCMDCGVLNGGDHG